MFSYICCKLVTYAYNEDVGMWMMWMIDLIQSFCFFLEGGGNLK